MEVMNGNRKIMKPSKGKMDGELLALQWKEHKNIFNDAIKGLWKKDVFTDATLACEGNFYPVHKFVLSTCSDYFSNIFEWTPCVNPVIVINNIVSTDLEALLDFMYNGEVSIKENVISGVLHAASCLRVRGLSIVDDEDHRAHITSKSPATSPLFAAATKSTNASLLASKLASPTPVYNGPPKKKSRPDVKRKAPPSPSRSSTPSFKAPAPPRPTRVQATSRPPTPIPCSSVRQAPSTLGSNLTVVATPSPVKYIANPPRIQSPPPPQTRTPPPPLVSRVPSHTTTTVVATTSTPLYTTRQMAIPVVKATIPSTVYHSVHPQPEPIQVHPHQLRAVSVEMPNQVEYSQIIVNQSPTIVNQSPNIVNQSPNIVSQTHAIMSHPQTIVSHPQTIVSQPHTIVSQPPTMVSQPISLQSQPISLQSQHQTQVSHSQTIVSQPQDQVIEAPTFVAEPLTQYVIPAQPEVQLHQSQQVIEESAHNLVMDDQYQQSKEPQCHSPTESPQVTTHLNGAHQYEFHADGIIDVKDESHLEDKEVLLSIRSPEPRMQEIQHPSPAGSSEVLDATDSEVKMELEDPPQSEMVVDMSMSGNIDPPELSIPQMSISHMNPMDTLIEAVKMGEQDIVIKTDKGNVGIPEFLDSLEMGAETSQNSVQHPTEYEFSDAQPQTSASSSAPAVSHANQVSQDQSFNAPQSSTCSTSINNVPVNNFTCPICEKGFKTKDSLRRHTKIHNKKQQMLSCGECNYTTINTRDMNVHKTTHSLIKYCPHCDYTTDRIKDLVEHKRIHTEPFSCPLCDFSSRSTKEFSIHKKTHPEPHQCPHCAYQSPRLDCLRKHLQKHTDKNDHTCSYCSFSTHSRWTLRQHLKSIHGNKSNKDG